MSDTYRLYCTHCTFGSSALEVSSTDNASKVLGYSVRATSLPANERGRLRQVFRAIERLLSYNLPSDATPLDKETCDASSAPRRLLFMPDIQGFQVAGQLCYRSQDTAGRPGSYFADMIVSPIDARQLGDAWSPLDCLRLWRPSSDSSNLGAKWCDSEDQIGEGLGGDGGLPLPAINSPSDLLEGCNGAVLTDQAFLAFLTNDSADTDKAELSAVIPTRWAEIPAAQRQELFVQILQATINLLDRRHGTVTIAVEPSLAALLFYGVCRVLPEKLIRLSDRHAGLSFSTYESAPERSMTNLVATTFLHESNSADLPPEIYHRGFACNTFTEGFKYGQQIAPGVFAHKIIGLLTAGENTPFSAVDELISMIDFMPGASISGQTLDILVQVDEEVRRYLFGSTKSNQNLPAHAAQLSPEATQLRSRCLLTAIERFSQQGHTAWPDDLLETTIAWSGDALAQKWPASQPIQDALRSNLPTGKEGKDCLERLLAINDGKPRIPDALLLECATEVSVTLRRIPSCIRTYLAGTGKDPAKWLHGLLKDIAQPSRETVVANTATGLFGEALLQAVTPESISRSLVSNKTLTNLLGHLIAFEKFSFDEKWGILLTHHELCSVIDSGNTEFQDALNRLFDSLSHSTPHCLTTRSAGENAALLKNWAAFTKDSDAKQRLIAARHDLHQALLPLLAEAAEQNNRRLPSFGNKSPNEKITAAAEKLDYLARCSGRGIKKLLEEALGEQNQQPENKQLVTSWVTSYLKEISAAKAPPALKGKSKETAVTSKTNRWPEIVPATKVIPVVALFLLACTAALYVFLPSENERKHPNGDLASASPSSRNHPPQSNSDKPPHPQHPGQTTDAPKNPSQPPTTNPASSPPNPPPIKTEDYRLKIDFDPNNENALIVNWNNDALCEKCSLKITTPTGPERVDSSKTRHKIKVAGYGTYTAELINTANGKLLAEATRTFEKPPASEIENVRLELTESETPALIFTVKPTTNRIPTDIPRSRIQCRILYAGNQKLPIDRRRTKTPDALSFSLPKVLPVIPTELDTVQFQLVTTTPLGDGHESKAIRLHSDQLKKFGTDWMDKQHEQLTVLGVKGVSELPEGKNSVPFPLPPTIPDKDVAFSLLGPQRSIPKKSTEEIITAPTENSIGNYGSFAKVGTDQKPLLAKLANFSIDRTTPWAPRGVLKLEEKISQRYRNLVRSSKVKLEIAGKPYYFQLVTPKPAPPLKIQLGWEEKTTTRKEGSSCPARNIRSDSGWIPDINLDTYLWIPTEELPVDTAAPEGHDPPEKPLIKAAIAPSESHDPFRLTLSLNNDDYANSELSTEQERDIQVISLKPFEWVDLPEKETPNNHLNVITLSERFDFTNDNVTLGVQRERHRLSPWKDITRIALKKKLKDSAASEEAHTEFADDLQYLADALAKKAEKLKANEENKKLLERLGYFAKSPRFSATDLFEIAQWGAATIREGANNEAQELSDPEKALRRIQDTIEETQPVAWQRKCDDFARELARSEININRYQSRSRVAGGPQAQEDSAEHAVVWFVCDTNDQEWEAAASKVDRKGYVKFEEVKRR